MLAKAYFGNLMLACAMHEDWPCLLGTAGRAEALYPDNAPIREYAGHALLMVGRPSDALVEVTVLAANPDEMAALRIQAAALTNMGRHDGARAVVAHMLALDLDGLLKSSP